MGDIISAITGLPLINRSYIFAGLVAFEAAILFGLPYILPAKSVDEKAPPPVDRGASAQMPPAKPAIKESPRILLNDGFVLVINNTYNISLVDGTSVEKQDATVRSPSGEELKIETFLLFNLASWEFDSSTSYVNSNGAKISNLSAFFDSDEFRASAARYEEIWALGLVSGSGNNSQEHTADLSRARAKELGWMLVNSTYSDKMKIFSVPLGFYLDNTDPPPSDEERRQRSIVVIGLLSEDGKIDHLSVVENILKSNGIRGFDSKRYSLVDDSKGIEFVQLSKTFK